MSAKETGVLLLAVALSGCGTAHDSKPSADQSGARPDSRSAPKSAAADATSSTATPQAAASPTAASPAAASTTVAPKPEDKSGEVVAKEAGQPKKSAEPATFTQVVAAVDLRKIPIPEQAVGYQRTAGHLSYELAMPRRDAEAFLKEQMAKLGCVAAGPPAELSKQMRRFSYTKDGFTLTAYVHEVERASGEGQRAALNINNHGNLDVATLPRPENADLKDTQAGVITYTTTLSVAEAIARVRKQLAEAGWPEYQRLDGLDLGSKEMQLSEYVRNGIHLSASVYSYPSLGKKPYVQFTMSTVNSELPVAPDAKDLRFDKDKARMQYRLSAPLDEVAKLFRQHFEQLGWKPFGKGAVKGERSVALAYQLGNDITRVEARRGKEGEVEVTLQGLINKTPEDLKQADARAEAKKLARRTNAVALPLPDDAKDVTLGKEGRELKFKTAKKPAELVEFYREKLTAAGWKERRNHTRAESRIGTFNVYNGEDAAFINMFRLNDATGTEVTAIAQDCVWKHPG
jgi:hypothetical protein